MMYKEFAELKRKGYLKDEDLPKGRNYSAVKAYYKKRLIAIRDGGFATPLLEEMMELYTMKLVWQAIARHILIGKVEIMGSKPVKKSIKRQHKKK